MCLVLYTIYIPYSLYSWNLHNSSKPLRRPGLTIYWSPLPPLQFHSCLYQKKLRGIRSITVRSSSPVVPVPTWNEMNGRSRPRLVISHHRPLLPLPSQKSDWSGDGGHEDSLEAGTAWEKNAHYLLRRSIYRRIKKFRFPFHCNFHSNGNDNNMLSWLRTGDIIALDGERENENYKKLQFRLVYPSTMQNVLSFLSAPQFSIFSFIL